MFDQIANAPKTLGLPDSALIAALTAAVVSIAANVALYWKRRQDEATDYNQRRADENADYAKRRLDADFDAKKDVLEGLIGNRFNKNCDEFLEALNKVAVVFHDSTEVKQAIKAYQERRDQDDYDLEEPDYKFVDLIKAMHRGLGVNLDPLNDEFFSKPFVAIEYEERDSGQDLVFRALMATRAAFLSAEHVRALNMIEIAFYGGDHPEKRVRDAWKALHYHLNTRAGTAEEQKAWDAKRVDLLIELLFEMARCLSYDFDRTQIKSSWYAPEAHAVIEREWTTIRQMAAKILSGDVPLKPIPIIIEEKADVPGELLPPTR